MKRLSITLLCGLLLIACPAWAQGPMTMTIVAGAGGAAGCSVCTAGDQMCESFECADFENGAKWSTVVNGQTVDPNASALGSPPAGSGTKALHVAASAATAYALYDHGSTISKATSTDVVLEFYLDAKTFDSGVAMSPIVLYQNSNGSGETVRYQFYWSSPDLYARCSGASDSSWVVVSLDAWHTLTIHLDATAASSTCKLDSGDANSFTRLDNDIQYMRLGDGLAEIGAGESYDIYFGRVYLDK